MKSGTSPKLAADHIEKASFFEAPDGLWGEINAGISGQVSSTTTLFANASYQSRFDGGGFAYTGKAGLRVNW